MDKKNYSPYFIFILLCIGLIFLRTGTEKILGGEFVQTLPKTLAYFAGKNPYPFMKSFLQVIAIPNSTVFAYLTMFGELFNGISITFSILYILLTKHIRKFVIVFLTLGLLGSAFLNDLFWLASGWTSPAAETLNMLMLVISLTGIVYVFRNFIPILLAKKISHKK